MMNPCKVSGSFTNQLCYIRLREKISKLPYKISQCPLRWTDPDKVEKCIKMTSQLICPEHSIVIQYYTGVDHSECK